MYCLLFHYFLLFGAAGPILFLICTGTSTWRHQWVWPCAVTASPPQRGHELHEETLRLAGGAPWAAYQPTPSAPAERTVQPSASLTSGSLVKGFLLPWRLQSVERWSCKLATAVVFLYPLSCLPWVIEYNSYSRRHSLFFLKSDFLLILLQRQSSAKFRIRNHSQLFENPPLQGGSVFLWTMDTKRVGISSSYYRIHYFWFLKTPSLWQSWAHSSLSAVKSMQIAVL
jgi:hypothetical protein